MSSGAGSEQGRFAVVPPAVARFRWWGAPDALFARGTIGAWTRRARPGSTFQVEQDRPEWAVQFVGAVEGRREAIDSATVDGLTSDAVLAALAPALVPLGYRVELGKRVVDRIRLPVLFGDGGRERVAYEVDAFQDDLGVVVEIEAGCGARGNAVYRDLIRRSAAPASSSGGAWPYRS